MDLEGRMVKVQQLEKGQVRSSMSIFTRGTSGLVYILVDALAQYYFV